MSFAVKKGYLKSLKFLKSQMFLLYILKITREVKNNSFHYKNYNIVLLKITLFISSKNKIFMFNFPSVISNNAKT